MLKVEHIGIAVKDISASVHLFEKLLKKSPYKTEEVESEGAITSFFQVGESKIELLQPTKADSPIAKFIANKGEGVHHIAFEVKNIYAEMERLKDTFILLNEKPKKGADNKLICFLHPKSTHGVLIELCQDLSLSEKK